MGGSRCVQGVARAQKKALKCSWRRRTPLDLVADPAEAARAVNAA